MIQKTNCYCGSPKIFQECCEPYINGTQKAPTAKALMQSRYAAFATNAADYLMATTHPSQRKHHSKEAILHWAKSNEWLRLKIIATTENTVEFKAYFSEKAGEVQIHHEKSTFTFEDDSWFYVDGIFY